jgi:hypothetical protein
MRMGEAIKGIHSDSHFTRYPVCGLQQAHQGLV